MNKIVRNSKELGEGIRAARLAKNWRQKDLAREASVRQASISEIENGVSKSKFDTVIKVLAVLDLDLAIISRKKAEFDPTDY